MIISKYHIFINENIDNEELFLIQSDETADALEFYKLSSIDDIEKFALQKKYIVYIDKDRQRIAITKNDNRPDMFIAGTRKYVLENQDKSDAKDTIKNYRLPYIK